MINPFEFATAGRILFGCGTVQQLPDLIATAGRRVLLVTGASERHAAMLIKALDARKISCSIFRVEREPDVPMIEEGLGLARTLECEVVVGIGGGSVIDTGKAVAALLTNTGPWQDYLEVVGKGLPLQHPSAPYIAVPTTAGTGAEVTRNAVIGIPDERVKVSLRSPYMLPRCAVIDPELTYGLPPAITAATGLDALTQCLEVFVNSAPTPLTDAVCREGLQRVRHLESAWAHDDPAARADLCVAALCGGLGLANAKLGAVHGIAGPLGGMFPAPHGAICACLLPHVMQANITALEERATDHPALARYTEVACILTGNRGAGREDGLAWVHRLCETLAVPGLAHYGCTTRDFDMLIDKARRASSMKGNPVTLTDMELHIVLQQAL